MRNNSKRPDVREILSRLRLHGVPQTHIVEVLAERGVHSTQATISRLGSGKLVDPRVSLYTALAELLAEYEK